MCIAHVNIDAEKRLDGWYNLLCTIFRNPSEEHHQVEIKPAKQIIIKIIIKMHNDSKTQCQFDVAAIFQIPKKYFVKSSAVLKFTISACSATRFMYLTVM